MTPTDPRQLALMRASIDFASNWQAEPAQIATARAHAIELGIPAMSADAGTLLRVLAAGSSQIVELGTRAGVSMLWLLSAGAGSVTSIDADAERQAAAREALAAAEIPNHRFRLINARPTEVVSRLSPGAYDMALVSDLPSRVLEQVEVALTLLRSGGLLVVDGLLWHDRVADPNVRDAETQAARAVLDRLSDDHRLTASLLPVGGGLLVAVRN